MVIGSTMRPIAGGIGFSTLGKFVVVDRSRRCCCKPAGSRCWSLPWLQSGGSGGGDHKGSPRTPLQGKGGSALLPPLSAPLPAGVAFSISKINSSRQLFYPANPATLSTPPPMMPRATASGSMCASAEQPEMVGWANSCKNKAAQLAQLIERRKYVLGYSHGRENGFE